MRFEIACQLSLNGIFRYLIIVIELCIVSLLLSRLIDRAISRSDTYLVNPLHSRLPTNMFWTFSEDFSKAPCIVFKPGVAHLDRQYCCK